MGITVLLADRAALIRELERRLLEREPVKGRYVKNFVKIFGADELLDRKELETKLVATVRSI